MYDGSLNRRTFLQGATTALSLAGSALGRSALGQSESRTAGTGQDSSYPGLIVRESKPENFEFPFPTLNSVITPNNLFFVRTHFGILKDVNRGTWRLQVEGHVERPLELSYDDLLKMPSKTQIAMLECSGNSRVFLVPKAKGIPWELGGVSNAEWTGVPLAAVLDRAGLKANAVEVVLEGADSGEVQDEPKSPGRIHFARSLPLAKAQQPEVLLAYKMNGADLSAAHGFPVRVVVPGWYGMASVKWLQRLVVTGQPFRGYYQTLEYATFQRHHGLPTLVTTTEVQVKAEIARPARSEVVRPNTTYPMHGAAWTGESEVTKVEVSADEGKTWAEAKLLDQPQRFTWRLWAYEWRTPGQAGNYLVMARATDAQGRVQPMQRNPDHRNSVIDHVLPIEVEVR